MFLKDVTYQQAYRNDALRETIKNVLLGVLLRAGVGVLKQRSFSQVLLLISLTYTINDVVCQHGKFVCLFVLMRSPKHFFFNSCQDEFLLSWVELTQTSG